jgi:hypothetical protein
LERHALSLQSAQLTRPRNYVESEGHELAIRHPRNAPEWTFEAQNIPPETDFSAPNTPVDPNFMEEDIEVMSGDEVVGEGNEEGEGERNE